MLKILTTMLVFVFTINPVFAATDMWVKTDRLNRRTCPSAKCGVAGYLMFREKASVYERKGEWARITDYYYASCNAGHSEYVKSGNSSCVKSNGIVDGKFAEWVLEKNLSEVRPADPSTGATGDYSLISGSDDYRKYKDKFAQSARKLIDSGQCSEQDFKEMGGWMKSTKNENAPTYFTYCGGMVIQNRIYLNAETGETYK